MFYLTNSLIQRFISFNAELIASVQEEYKFNEMEIIDAKNSDYRSELEFLYLNRLWLSSRYKKLSSLQARVKAVRAGKEQITASLLQQMEKVVTLWINHQQREVQYAYEDYLDNRYDPFYRNRSKQAKQKLAKLVELQQAIRKQKRITRS